MSNYESIGGERVLALRFVHLLEKDERTFLYMTILEQNCCRFWSPGRMFCMICVIIHYQIYFFYLKVDRIKLAVAFGSIIRKVLESQRHTSVR